MHVQITNDHNGAIVLIEPEQRPGLDRRVFRQLGDGYEWSHLSDFLGNGSRARWYGFASKELPSTMTCGG